MLLARTLLTAIFLNLFSQMAWADVVYQCSSKQFVVLEKGKLERREPKRFELVVDDKRKKIQFKDFEMPQSFSIGYFVDENWWWGGDEISNFVFKDGWLHGALANTWAISFSAECDKF
jgi:hypothetical protein